MTSTSKSIVDVRFRNCLAACKRLKKRMRDEKIDRTWFTDDKIFTVQTSNANKHSERPCICKRYGSFKREVAPARLLKGRKHFLQSLMVSLAVSKLGKTALFFVTPKAKESASFIPTKSRSVAAKPYSLVLDSQFDEDCVSVLKMSLLTKSESVYANAVESSERHEVTLIHMRATSSPEMDSLDFESLDSTNKILRRLTSTEINFNGPIIVMSQTDDTLSGFCVAAFNAFDMMTEEDEVDLYQIVRDIRKSKTTFIPSLHTYSELYNVVGKYIKFSN